jgi:nuclear migration protein JNM1
MNSQLALLTQSRHIDAISRRLKMLLTELERVSVAQQHRRQGSQANGTHHNQEQLLSTVNRISPSLPQIPHILARLRTLSTLHAAAGEFQDTLGDLEQEQKKLHGTLLELQSAVDTVEKSLEENRNVVKGNVTGLDARVEGLLKRLEDLRLEELQSNAVASEAEAED